MSDIKSISPLLNNFDIGEPISEHDGVRCYPAIVRNTDQQYIVKLISIPASQTQLDAFLLAGAYSNEEDALSYFRDLVSDLEDEIQLLQRLSKLEGFVCFENWQSVPREDLPGYHVCLLSPYRKTLAEHFERNPMTHLQAVNLGLDLCAALAVSRRAGYIYVDLKPGNIYIIHDKEYKIGDLGFIRLDSLKYASLPAKYRSAYTAPEIQDAFSALNTTMDVYAVGLILYQAYNNGQLPTAQEDGSYPPPDYADYEMAQIILKACAPTPEDRWQEPLEMGQALISYLQRNNINDTPIVPVSVPEETAAPEETKEDQLPDAEEEAPVSDGGQDLQPIIGAAESQDDMSAEDKAEVSSEFADDIPESDASVDDELSNLNALLEDDEETDPATIAAGLDYSDLSSEVSEILTQADALAEHPVPEAVVAPDPVEVSLPDTDSPEEDTATEGEDSGEDTPADEAAADTTSDAIDEQDEKTSEESTEGEANTPIVAADAQAEPESKPKRKFRGFGWILLSLAILALLYAGFLYYQHFYLTPVDAITLDGNQDSLVVSVESEVDETLLKVVCSDPHGNQITMPVVDGKAIFENLVPNTAYNVKVIVVGFHKLTGATATAYSTPAQTNIVQFNAVTGAEDGSVILGFTVDGPDATQWTVTYKADGESEKTVTSPAHMVTIPDLTVGKTYTFTLSPDTDLYVTGATEVSFTASALVYAQNVRITGFIDGKLTAAWESPENTAVPNWTVRCYNDSGYNETVITSENTAEFTGLEHSNDYTIEVTAAGMSVSQRVYVPKNAFTVSNFQAVASGDNNLTVTWQTMQQIPENGWILCYTIDEMEKQYSVSSMENSAQILNKIPGATYSFTLQGADGTVAITEPLIYQVPEAESFNKYNVTAENMSFRLYTAPRIEYTNSFSPTDNVYMLIRLNKKTTSSSDSITILYVIRDEEGNTVSYDSTKLLWRNLWTGSECVLAIPQIPEEAGQYTLSVYFNGAEITEQSITVKSAAN